MDKNRFRSGRAKLEVVRRALSAGHGGGWNLLKSRFESKAGKLLDWLWMKCLSYLEKPSWLCDELSLGFDFLTLRHRGLRFRFDY